MFNSLDTFLRYFQFQTRAQEHVPLVLVANKVDLAASGQRKVTQEEGRDLGSKFRCPFLETSAGENSAELSGFSQL